MEPEPGVWILMAASGRRPSCRLPLPLICALMAIIRPISTPMLLIVLRQQALNVPRHRTSLDSTFFVVRADLNVVLFTNSWRIC